MSSRMKPLIAMRTKALCLIQILIVRSRNTKATIWTFENTPNLLEYFLKRLGIKMFEHIHTENTVEMIVLKRESRQIALNKPLS